MQADVSGLPYVSMRGFHTRMVYLKHDYIVEIHHSGWKPLNVHLYLDNFMCCHSDTEAADQTGYLTQSQYTDTWPTSLWADLRTPGRWQLQYQFLCL